jgi:DNA-directed RNA polymerase subunit RPC12/RpoP
MPKCPKCGAEIDSVNYIETGLLIYERGEWVKDEHPDLETTCPECGMKISLDEAIAPLLEDKRCTQAQAALPFIKIKKSAGIRANTKLKLC